MITRIRQLIWHWRNWRQLQAAQSEIVLLHARLKRVEKVLGIENWEARAMDELSALNRSNN